MLADQADANSPASRSQAGHTHVGASASARGGFQVGGKSVDPHTRVQWEPTGEGRSRPEDGGVSGRPDAVPPEGSFSFKPRSLALIPGMSFRFTKSHRKQYKNSNFSPAKKSPNPGKHGQEVLRAQRETGFQAVSSLNAGQQG